MNEIEKYDSESSESEDDEEFYDGPLNKDGEKHGRGTLYFDKEKKNKFQGRFINGVKEGKGSFYFSDGSSLSGNFVNDSLEGRGLYLYDDGALMVGTYKQGELNGYSEEYDSDAMLTFAGNYKENVRTGVCHFFMQHGGRLFGVVNKSGQLTGKDVIYVYPDEKTYLKGKFDDGELESACEAEYDEIGDKNNPYSYRKIPNAVEIIKDAESSILISNHPMQPDCYEVKRVCVKRSNIEDANEGLFSLIKEGPDQVMSFYNGIKITHAEVDGRDWKYNDNTISLNDELVIDVPTPWCDTSHYCATLGHKANHSFEPNCKYDRFNHPRFGEIKCIRTIKEVYPGDELTVAYGYDHEKLDSEAPYWYREELKTWSSNNNT